MTPGLSIATDEYRTYINARYGYRIEYPSSFVPQGVSDSGDGQVFISPRKDAELRVFASACIEGSNSTPANYVAYYKQAARKHELTITYSRAGRGFAVVSGVKDSKTYYNKVLIDSEGWCTEFNFTYDHSKSKEYDPVTGHIAASFRR